MLDKKKFRMKLKEGIIVSIKFKNTNEINGMIRDMKDLQMKDLESRRKKFCTIIEHGNLLTITNNHMIFSFVWMDVWERPDILSKVMHISSVKEPSVIAWNGRRCKHSLHSLLLADLWIVVELLVKVNSLKLISNW